LTVSIALRIEECGLRIQRKIRNLNPQSAFLNPQSLLSYCYGETDVLHEAHLNHVQKRQKFSGDGRRGRA